jgi:peroxiredoxin
MTKRGIFITHWAIELIAGLLIFLMVTSIFMLSQPGIVMPLLKISGFLTTWVYPCLQIALIIGILLTMAAPKASGVAPWGIACLLITIVTNLWPIVVYWWDLPISWLGTMGIWIAPFAQAILFTIMLLHLARWILKIEQGDDLGNPKDRQEVEKWTKSIAGLQMLLAVSLTFFALIFGFLFIPPIQILFFRLFGMSAMIIPLLGVFAVLGLVAGFSRQVYRVNRLLSSKTDGTLGGDTSWSQIPPDSLRPSIVLPAVLALVSYGAYQAASYWLAPGYVQKQIAKMKLDFPSPSTVSTEPAGPDKSIGTSSPNLNMKTLAGDNIELASLKGKTVVLNFWATWCPPCVKEMPDLQKLSVDMADQDVAVIGISNETTDKLQGFVNSNMITFSIVSGDNWPAPFNQIAAIPTTFIIDAQGVIRDKFVGSRSYDQVRTAINKAAVKQPEAVNEISSDK